MASDSVDKIMQKIREEIHLRKSLEDKPLAEKAWTPSEHSKVLHQKTYLLQEFLVGSDEEFIRFAYQAILKRAPKPGEIQHYFSRLQAVDSDRIKILIGLCYSEEGQKYGVNIKGLRWRSRLRAREQMRFFGPLVRLASSLLDLPFVWKSIFNLFNMLKTKLAEQSTAVEQKLAEQSTAVEQKQQEYQTEILQIQTEMRNVLHQNQTFLLETQRIVKNLIEETKKRLPEELPTNQIQKVLEEQKHLLDSLYVTFTNRFRGTREEIQEKHKVYLPYFAELFQDQKNALPILDLGCGRGEWLSLLKQEGYRAQGVDCNRIMVQEACQQSLEVQEGDALAFLKKQEANSLAAITGFHIIEHLPWNDLIDLVDEACKALQPGGLLLLETPNPENILVGSNTFYLDPTHIHPLPSATMQFLLEQRGFQRVSILYLHPEKYDSFEAADAKLASKLNHYFYGPKDYAILGYKS